MFSIPYKEFQTNFIIYREVESTFSSLSSHLYEENKFTYTQHRAMPSLCNESTT
jgi:hypothetical protein